MRGRGAGRGSTAVNVSAGRGVSVQSGRGTSVPPSAGRAAGQKRARSPPTPSGRGATTPRSAPAARQSTGGRPSAGAGRSQPANGNPVVAAAGGGGRGKPSAPPVISAFVFTDKVRRPLTHRQRNPHRQFVHPSLIKITAHWMGIPQGTVPLGSGADAIDVAVKRSTEVTVLPPPETEKTGNLVNARALIVPGSKGSEGSHPVNRVQLIGGVSTSGKQFAAYGGLVNAGLESSMFAQLAELVSQQSGLDLSNVTTWYKFLELSYKDKHPTIFWMPALWEATGELQVVPQATEEQKEVEEEYVDEEVDEDALKKLEAAREKKRKAAQEAREARALARKAAKAKKAEAGEDEGEDDDDEEAEEEEAPLKVPMKKVRKTRTVTKTIKTATITPKSVSLSGLLSSAVGESTAADTQEFCAGADALDEFLRRENAFKVLDVLRTRKEEHALRRQKQAQEDEVVAGKKRKREELEEEVLRQRKERNSAQQQQWEEEESGMTDEEKKQAAIDRRDFLRKQRLADEEEDCERRKRAQEEEKSVVERQPKMRRWVEVDKKAVEAFQYFDRTGAPRPSGCLAVTSLQDIVLSLDEDMSYSDVKDLLDLPQVPKSGAVQYKELAQVQKEEPEPSPKKPEPSPKKSTEDEAGSPSKSSPRKSCSPAKGSPQKSPAKRKSPAKKSPAKKSPAKPVQDEDPLGGEEEI